MAEEQRPPRDEDDPVTIAERARAQVVESADALRKAKVPTATEPPTVYRP